MRGLRPSLAGATEGPQGSQQHTWDLVPVLWGLKEERKAGGRCSLLPGQVMSTEGKGSGGLA